MSFTYITCCKYKGRKKCTEYITCRMMNLRVMILSVILLVNEIYTVPFVLTLENVS